MDLGERARVHAALGDPARLAVVDALALGDLSPGDLARQLDLPSNLLAHHLRVLEQAHVIERHRSEGDRRRSYVRLRADNPIVCALNFEPILDGGSHGRERVVFVCTHNSARSQLAAAAWQQVSSVPVASAGTHPAARVHPGAVRAARRHGLPLEREQPRHVDEVLTPDDLVVAVCDQVHEELPDGPRLHWSVPDPVRTATAEDFETAFTDIVHRVGQLARAVGPPVP
jgi:protein-tyrosine-phosphatase